jgi:hypothetical protein
MRTHLRRVGDLSLDHLYEHVHLPLPKLAPRSSG